MSKESITKLPLWQQYVLVSAVGGFAVAGMLIGVGIEEGAELVALLITWVGQWLVLRRHISRASRWLLASSLWALVGFTVGAVEGTYLQDAIDGVESSPLGIASIGPGRSYLGYYLGMAVVGAGFGAALGYGQWMILRWSFRRAGWWVLASTYQYVRSIFCSTRLKKDYEKRCQNIER